MVPIGPQRLGLFGRLYRALRNTKYGRLLLELMTRTPGCLILAGLQHPGPLRGPPTAGPTLAMTNLPIDHSRSRERLHTTLKSDLRSLVHTVNVASTQSAILTSNGHHQHGRHIRQGATPRIYVCREARDVCYRTQPRVLVPRLLQAVRDPHETRRPLPQPRHVRPSNRWRHEPRYRPTYFLHRRGDGRRSSLYSLEA